jgi:hypothetical protein
MRPIYVKRQNVTSAASSTSGWIVMDQYVAPGNAIMSIKLTQKTGVTPTGTLTAVFTNDDIFDPSLNGAFANQVYTATPFNASGAWTITGFTGINSVVVVEATFDYVPRAVGTNLVITAGQVDFETQVIQLGIAST